MVCVEAVAHVRRVAEAYSNRIFNVRIIKVGYPKQIVRSRAVFRVLVAIDCNPSTDRRVMKRTSFISVPVPRL